MNSISLLLNYIYYSGLITGFIFTLGLSVIVHIAIIFWRDHKWKKKCLSYTHKSEKEVTKR